MTFYKVKNNSGFKMDGYFIWCGSAIKGDNGKYYLFASRWPEETGFPDGYMTNSEIALASADKPDGEYKFEKVIIAKREGNFWDSMMAHNPFITKIGNKYVLFYIGSCDGRGETRKIGYAYSENIEDGWIRSDEPIELPDNANNPAVIDDENGNVLLYFRDGRLKVSVGCAKSYDRKFEILNDNLFDKGKIEDMFLFKKDGKFFMVCEDAEGVYTGLSKGGVIFSSSDGINFEFDSKGYGYDIEYENGDKLTLQRRERPFILFNGDKKYLFTSAKIGGEDVLTGGKTWNMVQEIKEF